MNSPVEPTALFAGTQRHTFPKTVRLRRRREFLAVQRSGGRVTTPHFTFLIVPSLVGAAAAPARLGVTASRHVGNSVERNRAKRLVREAFRLHDDWFPRGYDMVVVLRSGASRLDLAAVAKEWSHVTSVLRRQAERTATAVASSGRGSAEAPSRSNGGTRRARQKGKAS